MKELLNLERKIFAYSNGVPRKSDRDYFRRRVMRYAQGLDQYQDLDACIWSMCDDRSRELHGEGVASNYYGYNGAKTFITDDFRRWAEITLKQYNYLVKTSPALRRQS